MSDPAENYDRARALVDALGGLGGRDELLKAAQVHATLAVADAVDFLRLHLDDGYVDVVVHPE